MRQSSAWIAWLLASLFSLVQFFLQVASSMMTKQYGAAFHLDHTHVGLLSSAFFYSYVAVQIPVGLLLDRYNVRRVLLVSCLVMALGCLAFAVSQNYFQALVARVLMGAGAGFAFVSMVFISGHWFPKSMFAFLVGLGEFVGMFGTSVAEHAVPYAILAYGWRDVMVGTAVVSLLLWVGMWCCLRDHPEFKPNTAPLGQQVLRNLRQVLPLPRVWLAGIFCCGMFGLITTFSSLWGVPFLQHAQNMHYLDATSATAWSIMGIAVGGPLVGAFSGWVARCRSIMWVCSGLATVVAVCLIWHVGWSVKQASVILFILGLLASSYVLAFAIVDRFIVPELKGTAIGLCNALALAGAVVLQPVTGWLLTITQATHGKVQSFQIGLSVLPGVMLLAFIAVMGIWLVDYIRPVKPVR